MLYNIIKIIKNIKNYQNIKIIITYNFEYNTHKNNPTRNII
jgi:hypothetical protein